ncbi:MAG: hypothetical protein H6839_11255 [Planctomycetes bacterium]|nr:hypothetical protein [Planctomycetota bacterium]
MTDSEQPEEASQSAEAAAGTGDAPRMLKQCVLVFLLACVCAAYLQTNPGLVHFADGHSEWSWNRFEGIREGDSSYHIKAAWLYRTGEVGDAGKDFHWTRESVWNGHFSDKDFLYHVYLIPFTLPAEDQFHWQAFTNGAKLAAIIAGGLFALALLASLRQFKVPRAWLWTLATGGLMGVIMAARLTEVRSWVFGVCLAMLGWAALWRGSRRWTFVVAVLYVLSYTGCHLLLAMALFRLLLRQVLGPEEGTRKQALKQDGILTGVVLSGLALGWLIHPQSFELLYIWWVQNLVVPLTHAGIAGIGNVSEVPPGLLGSELRGWPVLTLLTGATWLFVAVVLLPLSSLVARTRPSQAALATFIIALGFTLLSLLNGRFVEYAVPFMLIASARWLSDVLSAPVARQRLAGLKLSAQRQLQFATALLVVLLAINLLRTSEEIGWRPRAQLETVGVWMQDHDELSGKVIYNVSWDSFPELLLFRSDCDYIWGMDPMFTAANGNTNSRRVIGLMAKDTSAWSDDPAEVSRILREDLHADYIFVHDRDPGFPTLNRMLAWSRAGVLQPEFARRQQGIALFRVRTP